MPKINNKGYKITMLKSPSHQIILSRANHQTF